MLFPNSDTPYSVDATMPWTLDDVLHFIICFHTTLRATTCLPYAIDLPIDSAKQYEHKDGLAVT